MKVETDILYEAALRQLNEDEYSKLFILLSNTSPTLLRDVISSEDIVKVMHFLDFEENHRAESLIKLLFSLFPPEFVHDSLDMLSDILSLENLILSTILLKEISTFIKNSSSSEPIVLFSSHFLHSIIKFIFQDNLELSIASQVLLKHYCLQSSDVCITVFNKFIHPVIDEISSSKIFLLRYFEMSVDIALMVDNHNSIESVISEVFVEKIKNNFNISNSDILMKLNVIEIINKIVISKKFLFKTYTLYETGLMDCLYYLLQNRCQEQLDTSLITELISLFAELMKTDSMKVTNDYPDFLFIIQNQIEDSENKMDVLCAIESIAHCALHPNCKIILREQYGNVVSCALSKLVNYLTSNNTEHKIRGCDALAHILMIPTGTPNFDNLSKISESWWRETSAHSTTLNLVTEPIMKLIVVPSEDLRLSGLNLALSVSNQTWGQRILCNDDHFVEWILDRNEGWKSCIDCKYEVMSNLVIGIRNSNNSICNRTTGNKLDDYCQKGKYFGQRVEESMLVETDV